MNKEQVKNRDTIFLELKKTGFIDETTENELAFKLGYQTAINFTNSCEKLKEKNTLNLRNWAKQQGYTLTAQEFIKNGLLFSVNQIHSEYIAREE